MLLRIQPRREISRFRLVIDLEHRKGFVAGDCCELAHMLKTCLDLPQSEQLVEVAGRDWQR